MAKLIPDSDGSLTCSCGNDVFIPMGDSFSVTIVECTKCSNRFSIVESTLIAEKLLSPLGEDYCRIYGTFENDFLFVDRLVFTEFQTEITMSANDRLSQISAAKLDAIKNEWLERAAKLREEEKLLLQRLHAITKNKKKN